jgi:hypothetical protein
MIVGHVADPGNASAGGVKVTLREENTNVITSQTTNAQGDYVFSNIKPGTYQLAFEAQGFAPRTVDHLVLEVNQAARQDITLQLGTVTSSVQVTAEHTLVQTDTSSVGSVIESTQIRRMPLNGRTNMFGLLALSPGVQRAGTNPLIGSSSYIGVQATMDGALNMEMENTRLSNADPSLESLGEFRVIDSTGSAEYGGGTAQVIASALPVGNAQVSLLNEQTGGRRLALSNESGAYSLPSLSPGVYRLMVRATGFQTSVTHGLRLEVGDDTRLDFLLRLGDARTVVTVQADTPLMNTESASVGTVIDRRTIDEMPLNGRGIQALIELSPVLWQFPSWTRPMGSLSPMGNGPMPTI